MLFIDKRTPRRRRRSARFAIVRSHEEVELDFVHELNATKVHVPRRMMDAVSTNLNASFCWYGGRILPEHTWKCFLGLERLGEDDVLFQEIGAKFVMFADEWAEWYQSPCPEEGSLPGDFATAGDIQTLCVLRVLRPDRIVFALRNFVSELMGEEFVSQPTFSMRSVYEDSSASTPILFLLFPGVDPTTWVEGLGQEMGTTTANEMLSNISMGEGEGPVAARYY